MLNSKHLQFKISKKGNTYSEPGWCQNLLARNGIDDGKISLHANNHQNENRCGVTQRMYELVHFAHKLTKHPARNRRNWGPKISPNLMPLNVNAIAAHYFFKMTIPTSVESNAKKRAPPNKEGNPYCLSSARNL